MVYIKSHNPEPDVTLGTSPHIAENARVIQSDLGAYTELRSYVDFIESSLGDYSYVMDRSSIIYSQIGKFVNIASDVRINPCNHPMEWVSQHHIMYRRKHYGLATQDTADIFTRRKKQKVIIGHDVWVGHGSTIMPGVSVGNGAIIGAGAVVTHNVAPYTIVGGVPEKEIRRRFDSETIDAIEKSAWWDWDHETIKKRLDDFKNVDGFIAQYGNSH